MGLFSFISGLSYVCDRHEVMTL